MNAMKAAKYSMLVLMLAIFTGSCKKDRLKYDGEPGDVSGIYFLSVATTDINGVPTQYRDSLEYSFQNLALDVTEANLPLNMVRVFGNVADHDRIYKFKVAGGTAVEGVDYEKLKSEYIMAAGKALATPVLKLYRTPKLEKTRVTIILELEETDDFKLLLPFVNNITDNRKMSVTKFKIGISDIVTPSFYWSIFAPSYFGDWSVKKFKLLNDLMGWTAGDWQTAGQAGKPIALGKFPYAANLLKDYLQNKADIKEPVYEDDGVTLMQLAPSYAVDYSKIK